MMRTPFFAFLFALLAALPLRADTIVTAEAIAARIAEAIAARLPTAGRYRVALADPAYQLPASRYEIAALNYDPARQAFAATLSFANAANGVEYARISGNAFPVIEVPALARDVASGEVISAADIITIDLPLERASAALLTSSPALAGQAAKRPLRARTPLFSYDFRKPVVVKKGVLVTIVYALPGIELTTQGHAQADAGKGDAVSVLNTRSRRTIEARVVGPGLVSVSVPVAAVN